MRSPLQIVEAQALKLSAEERVQLADRLSASIFEDQDMDKLAACTKY